VAPEQLGQRIRQIREERGISQEQLADLIARDQRAVSLYESGQRRIYAHDIPKIAQALDVPLAYLFDDVVTEGDLDSILLKEFHRFDTGTRKKMIEIMRLFSEAWMEKNDT
jgi:transcriptional regulator with XRE-family HTH domain